MGKKWKIIVGLIFGRKILTSFSTFLFSLPTVAKKKIFKWDADEGENNISWHITHNIRWVLCFRCWQQYFTTKILTINMCLLGVVCERDWNWKTFCVSFRINFSTCVNLKFFGWFFFHILFPFFHDTGEKLLCHASFSASSRKRFMMFFSSRCVCGKRKFAEMFFDGV